MPLNIFGKNITIPGMPGTYGDAGLPGGVHTIGDNSSSGEDNSLAQIAMKVIQQATSGANAAGTGGVVSRPDIILPKPTIKPQLAMNTGTPTGNVQATTRAGQRRNDFNDLIQSVGNIVKMGINQKRQNDERDIMHDLAVIQAAASNPEDPHNKMILDKMAKDPKVIKRLQKALGYNPLSGDAPGPETQAMMKYGAQVQMKTQAKEQAQAQAGQAMQNLLSRMPNTQQINPVVAMQAELIKAGILPKNDLSPKALLDFVTEAMKDKTKQQEILERAKATNNQSLMRLYDTIIRAQASMDATKMRGQVSRDVANIRAGATKYAADKRAETMKSYQAQRDRTIDNLKKTSDAYAKSIAELDVEIATALKQSQGKDTDDVKRLRDEQTRLKSLKNSIDDTAKHYMEVVPDASGVDELEQSINPSIDEMNQGDFIFNNSQPINP